MWPYGLENLSTGAGDVSEFIYLHDYLSVGGGSRLFSDFKYIWI